VVDPGFPIPAGWELFRSADDGYQNPAAVLWWARDPVLERFYIVSELYKAGMLPDEMARHVLERDRTLLIRDPDGEVHAHDKTLSGYIDSSSFSDTGTGAVARGNRMNALGCRWTSVVKTPESRIQGVHRLHELLGTMLKDGLPQLRVFSSRVNLVKAIPRAPRDEDRPEDIDPDWPQDHLLDAHNANWGAVAGIRDGEKRTSSHRWEEVKIRNPVSLEAYARCAITSRPNVNLPRSVCAHAFGSGNCRRSWKRLNMEEPAVDRNCHRWGI
jgi:hypothetical protein